MILYIWWMKYGLSCVKSAGLTINTFLKERTLIDCGYDKFDITMWPIRD
jgi:hypothetical protein